MPQRWRGSDVPAVRMHGEGLVISLKIQGTWVCSSRSSLTICTAVSFYSGVFDHKRKSSFCPLGWRNCVPHFLYVRGRGSWSWFMSRCRTYLVWQLVTPLFHTSRKRPACVTVNWESSQQLLFWWGEKLCHFSHFGTCWDLKQIWVMNKINK